MKKYDSYKDSEIEWIGDIPSHWESWKISHAFNRIGSGTTPESGNPIYHENGTINWLNTGDLNDGVLDSCSKKITTKALDDYSSLKLFPTGSLVMAMYGATIGKTAILNFETTTNQACCVFCDSSIIDLKFLQYWFIGNKEQIINLAIGGGQPNISQNILKDIRVWCPDYSEQGSLTNFLDQKTTQIDHLITKKEQFIQLLEEERIAVINQAVTKGLDQTVPMKDSGIEWLGEIPEHWEKTRLKRLIDEIFLGLTAKVDYVENPEDGVAFIRAGNLFGGKLDLSDMKYISRKQHESLTKFRQVQRGDVLVTKSGSIGVCAILDVDGEFSLYESVFAIRPTREFLLNEYLLLLLNSHLMKQQYTADMVGMGVHHLNMGDMKNTIIPIPSIEEQESILNEIKVRIDEIELTLVKIREELELLKEYKTALISEVVTGKVDVSTSSTQVLETKN